MTVYATSLFVLTLLVAMVVLQAIIATAAHRKQSAYIPGIVDEKLDHHSFVFRSHRTFQNSMENVPLFVITALLAIAVGVSATSLFYATLVFSIARFIHMVLFYKIATNKNPSPRSYFYMIALITQLYLLGITIIAGFSHL